jgi:hypothetical protein
MLFTVSYEAAGATRRYLHKKLPVYSALSRLHAHPFHRRPVEDQRGVKGRQGGNGKVYIEAEATLLLMVVEPVVYMKAVTPRGSPQVVGRRYGCQ